jgi:TolA-binding protein
MGIARARCNRYADAGTHLEQFLAGDKKSAGRDTAFYELAFVKGELKQAPERDRCLRMVVTEHSKSSLAADSAFRLGNSEYDAGNFAKALADYRFVIENADGDLLHKARYKAGWAQTQLKRPKDAGKLFDEVAATEHALAAESTYLAGQAYEEAGELAAATERFLQMTSNHSKHELAGDAACRVVILLGRQGQLDDVIRLAPKVLSRSEKEPRAVGASLALGHAYAAKKQWESARAAFRMVTKSSEGPMAAEAQFGIAQTYAHEGNRDRALDEFLRVSILYGHEDWVARATLASAQLLEEQGEKAKARRLYEDLARDHETKEEGKKATTWLRKNPGESRK